MDSLMSLNNDKIRDIITRYNKCTQEVESIVKSIESGELLTVNNSWVANEAKIYTNKVVDSNAKVRKVNDGLRVLSSTYSKALSDAQRTSSAVNTVVTNI